MSDDLRAYAAEHLEASRARCGLPARVEDQEALGRIAALVRTYQLANDARRSGNPAGGAVVDSDRESTGGVDDDRSTPSV